MSSRGIRRSDPCCRRWVRQDADRRAGSEDPRYALRRRAGRTPLDLRRTLHVRHAIVRARYEAEDCGPITLADVLEAL